MIGGTVFGGSFLIGYFWQVILGRLFLVGRFGATAIAFNLTGLKTEPTSRAGPASFGQRIQTLVCVQ
jgi:hypothetical protein